MRNVLRVLSFFFVLVFVFSNVSQAPNLFVSPHEFLDWPSKPIGKTSSYLIVLHVNPNYNSGVKRVISVLEPYGEISKLVAFTYTLGGEKRIFIYDTTSDEYVETHTNEALTKEVPKSKEQKNEFKKLLLI